MKIQNSTYEINEYNNIRPKHYSPNFKAGAFGGALNAFGGTMQWIENKGFLASFLIQDCLGMTVPRGAAGFLRDKEVTGVYNTQEGFEVLGREGLTGPCMMAVAPLMFGLAAKFGKTTSVNSQLIRRFGNSLKEMVSKPEFNNELLNNKDLFKQEFYKTNIKQMLTNTLNKENVKEEQIKFILEEISKYENLTGIQNIKGIRKKSKLRNQCINNITEYINNIKLSTSSELDILGKLKVGSEKSNNIKAFSTKDAIEAMIKYSDDAIIFNKKLNQLDSAMAENLKESSIAKRMIVNIGTMASTLGVLSILPKIYARSSVAPGAKTAMQLKEKREKETGSQAEIKSNNVSFKGAKNNQSWLSRLGKFISKHTNEKYSSELEYNGHNFTNSLMAGLSLFGLLAPRGLRAYNRAQVDENGKKDLTELYEILIRDISSSLAVVFAVPMLTRACVTSYEKQSGFVLMQKDRSRSKLATSLDLLNPYSKAHVLKNSEINALYNNITSQEKMINFCKYINENQGDLQKILSKSEQAQNVFNSNNFNLEELSKLPKEEKNKKIQSFFENLGKDKKLDKKSIDELITKLMKGNSAKPKGNKILTFARGLNSIPAIITTFLISPYLLGWFIPRLTYANTRRLHEKKAQEKQNKINKAV